MPRDLVSGAGVLWKSPSGQDDKMLEDYSGKQGNCYWTRYKDLCNRQREQRLFMSVFLFPLVSIYIQKEI